MTAAGHGGESAIWRARRALSRAALASAAFLLLGGIALALAGHAASPRVLGVACGLLVSIPILNVAAVLGVEIQRREWRFVAATSVVIALLAYAVLTRVLLRP